MKRLACLLIAVACVAGVLATPHATEAVAHGANGRIAFVSDRTGFSEIWTMDADGRNARNVSRRPAWGDWQPAWSPEGLRLVWTAGARTDGLDNWEIFAANANGSGQVNLTTHPAKDMFPRWSPDGSKIVFESDRSGNDEIWVMNADGSDLKKLTNHSADDGQPVWSPDGSRIAFGSYRSGFGDIWVMNANGTGLFNVTARTSEDWSPSWSPNGKEIAFDSKPADPEGLDIWAVRPDGTGLRQLTPTVDTVNEGFPRWSPDGTKITFTSDKTYGEDNVWVMNADGTNPVALTTSSSSYNWLSDWQPLHAFIDVAPMDIFHHNIESIAAVGITKGCNPPANTMYCPKSYVTRGQMAAFLTRALKLPAASKNYFTDDVGSVFENDINRLAKAGITKGCNPPANTMYCPDGYVTRGQMAAFLVRALGYTDNGGGNLFIDDDDSVFEGDIDRLGTAGVTKGCNPPANTMYCPDSYVTRGQMAAFLTRALGLPAVP
jgi:TolB protein